MKEPTRGIGRQFTEYPKPAPPPAEKVRTFTYQLRGTNKRVKITSDNPMKARRAAALLLGVEGTVLDCIP